MKRELRNTKKEARDLYAMYRNKLLLQSYAQNVEEKDRLRMEAAEILERAEALVSGIIRETKYVAY